MLLIIAGLPAVITAGLPAIILTAGLPAIILTAGLPAIIIIAGLPAINNSRFTCYNYYIAGLL